MRIRSSYFACVMILSYIMCIGIARAGDTSQNYAVIKRYFSSHMVDNHHSSDKRLWLYECNGPEIIFGEGEVENKHIPGEDGVKYKHKADFIYLAFSIVDLSNNIDRSGYPRAIWKDTLDQYEERQLKSIAAGAGTTADTDFDRDSRFLKSIAKLLSTYRLQSGKTSLAVPDTVTSGCGG
jgi:hypothetical protein